ncbi:hypothetical protein D3C78_1917440 [compost metagenome]
MPVRSSASPISELLTNPAILANEQASAKPVAAAVPRRKVAGRLKNTGTAPMIAAWATENSNTVAITL